MHTMHVHDHRRLIEKITLKIFEKIKNPALWAGFGVFIHFLAAYRSVFAFPAETFSGLHRSYPSIYFSTARQNQVRLRQGGLRQNQVCATGPVPRQNCQIRSCIARSGRRPASMILDLYARVRVKWHSITNGQSRPGGAQQQTRKSETSKSASCMYVADS